jgi:hypothetical protein
MKLKEQKMNYATDNQKPTVDNQNKIFDNQKPTVDQSKLSLIEMLLII